MEGATGCPSWCRPLRPLFHFLCSNLKANPVNDNKILIFCDLRLTVLSALFISSLFARNAALPSLPSVWNQSCKKSNSVLNGWCIKVECSDKIIPQQHQVPLHSFHLREVPAARRPRPLRDPHRPLDPGGGRTQGCCIQMNDFCLSCPLICLLHSEFEPKT